MEYIRVYHLSTTDLGHVPTLTPRVPECHLHGEDLETPRICCSTTVIGCIMAMPPFMELGNIESRDFWLYEAHVPVANIEQPTHREVPDVWQTGELWITQEQDFLCIGKYHVRKHVKWPDMPFSRYAFTLEGEEEIVDCIVRAPIYGDIEAFSYLDIDASRADEATAYAEEKHMIV